MIGPHALRTVMSAVLAGLLPACAVLKPLPENTTLADRLAVFPTERLPLQGPVTIHWNDHQVPFIEAEHDADAAFALGLVHAHLRLGQMEIYRRIAQGRIAEMGGPLATDIDHGIRILDFGRAATAIEAAMSAETRVWVQRFVDGINYYQKTVEVLPYEFGILGLTREPWTVADVLTFGRLSGTDVNWLVWFNLLRLRDRPDWPEIWARLVDNGGSSHRSFGGDDGAALDHLLASLSRSGSNSLAIAPSRTATGAAIIANDPHLGINLPNTWLLAGVKSPSHHAIGLMVPGLPVFAIGRNPWISWGGTNMRAAASDLYDISGVPAERIRERRETIGVRWWFDRDVTVRETPWGPVLSDAPQLADAAATPFALRWTGHRASDEIGAMLKVSTARNFQEFRDAFRGFAVPGQNMLYADGAGHIGQVMAVALPARDGVPPPDIILAPDEADPAWQRLITAENLPFSLDPEQGFLASANNRPAVTGIALGHFFSPDDRVRRMAALVGGGDRIGLDDVKRLQRDVFVESSVALRDLLLGKLDAAGIVPATEGERAVLELMRSWDGHYRAEERGPVAFEIFRHAFTSGFYQALFGEADWAAFANVGRIKSLLIEDIERKAPEDVAPLLRASLARTAERIAAFDSWGDMHRLRLRHPLAFLPIVGGRFRFADVPIGGSTDSLMKTAHGSTEERHAVGYGANARHISDLSDMDRNYFVLLGGQDGWLNSSTFLDQLPIWLSGDYIQVPLRPETVRARFRHALTLSP